MKAEKETAPISKSLISAETASGVQSKAVFKSTEFLAPWRLPNLEFSLLSVVEGFKA
jgi:hypothetical protein